MATEKFALGSPEPPAARCGAFHRARRDPLAVDPEEQLGGGREHPIWTRIQVGAVAAALREAEVPVKPPLVAGDPGSEPDRVVDLVGLTGGDRAADRLDGGLVAAAIGRRRPPVP